LVLIFGFFGYSYESSKSITPTYRRKEEET
jgi:hypothetical protein